MSIKSIKEKELLVNFARAMGQEVDPRLVEDVERINAIRKSVRASVSENIFKDLGAAVTSAKGAPIYVADVTMPDPGPGYDMDDGPLTEDQLEQIQETVTSYPVPPSLDELLLVLNEQIEEVKNELVQAQPEKESPETETPVPSTPTLADRTSDFLSKSKDSYQQPDPLIVSSDMDAITKKLRFLEQWIGKISMAGPGGGAGSVAKLDHETKLIDIPAYSISTKDYYLGVNYAGPVTITLPTIVNNGRMYIIKDESGSCSTNPITVLGNVDNDPGGFILAQDNGGIQLIYRNGWRIV